MEQEKAKGPESMLSHIVACKASGMKVGAYCREHHLKRSNYYYWQKKLHQPAAGKFIGITPLLSNAPVSIIMANGHRICFEALPPPDYIKQLVS